MKELNELPALWSTESMETQNIQLPLRFACSWHGLTWYPAEFDPALEIAYGLTVRMQPEWRHFRASELAMTHGGRLVQLDRRHVVARVPFVPDVKRYQLDDLTPFLPSSVPELGIEVGSAAACSEGGAP